MSDHEVAEKIVVAPDIDQNDSARLRGFCRMTTVEVKAVGMISAATSLEMIGYMRELEISLTTAKQELARAMIEAAIRQSEAHVYDCTNTNRAMTHGGKLIGALKAVAKANGVEIE